MQVLDVEGKMILSRRTAPVALKNSQDAKCQFEVVYGGVAKEKKSSVHDFT